MVGCVVLMLLVAALLTFDFIDVHSERHAGGGHDARRRDSRRHQGSLEAFKVEVMNGHYLM